MKSYGHFSRFILPKMMSANATHPALIATLERRLGKGFFGGNLFLYARNLLRYFTIQSKK